MIIKNRNEICTTEARKQALDIIEAGISTVLPRVLMKSAFHWSQADKTVTISGDCYDVSRGRIFVIGGGKASGLMAETLETIITPEYITSGVVTCKASADEYHTERIKIIQASHPSPDERGIAGVQQMLDLKRTYSVSADDVVLCLISGGGSALMPCPVVTVQLQDIQKITELLLASGADIYEINTVRKHLSKTAGGGLGRFFAPTTVVSLILSDVIGNDLSVIASGPTSADPTTFLNAWHIIEKYNLVCSAPENVLDYLNSGLQGLVDETPKTLNNCHNYIIGDNRLALESMFRKAVEMGRKPYIVTAELKGDTESAAINVASDIMQGVYAGYDTIVLGGETTPKLPEKHGKGGRNQHYVAVSLLTMQSHPGEWVVASVGTDGTDFLPDAAGAIIDNSSIETLRDKKLDLNSYIRCFDSYTLFKNMMNSHIITGETGTNVGDVMLYLLR